MRLLLGMTLLLALTGCSSLMGTAETNLSACSVWKDISWSSKDTAKTVTEIKVSNARREGYCEKK